MYTQIETSAKSALRTISDHYLLNVIIQNVKWNIISTDDITVNVKVENCKEMVQFPQASYQMLVSISSIRDPIYLYAIKDIQARYTR